MKTETEIKTRIEEIENIFNSDYKDNLSINYLKKHDLLIEKNILKWIIDDKVIIKNSEVGKRINISSHKSVGERVVILLKDYPKGLTLTQIADKLNYPKILGSSVGSSYFKKYVHDKIILYKYLAGHANTRLYYLNPDYKKEEIKIQE